ncbi:MAG: hypothetical protein CMO55_26805 [Verrucomicrobiales bacterium]|nr:hypothetical protein [Verrucomicrobiales bacterium]
MSDFISTPQGKIVNVNAIAFLTTRTKTVGKETVTQLLIGFSAATAVGEGGLMPLSLLMEGSEATLFLNQLGQRGVDVAALQKKLS